MPEPEAQTKQPQKASILDLLKAVLPVAGQMMAPRPPSSGGMVSPGRVGPVGTPFSPSLPGGLRLPGAMGMPSANQPQAMPVNQAPDYQTGFQFSNKGARDAAVATNALQGLSTVITQYKNKEQEKTRARAEGYMSQIIAAQQSGDQNALNLLLEDPKVIKTLEKGLEYYLPKVPGEPPTPESTGIHGAIKKAQQRLPAPNTPGGVSIPRMNETQSAQSEAQRLAAIAALKKLQGDPELAAQQGLGTALSGAERRQAERFATSLDMTPAQEATLKEEERKALQTFEMFKTEQENKLKMSAAEISGGERIAQIHAGPLYERARIAKALGDAQIKMREQVAKGNAAGATKIALQTLTAQIDTLRNASQRAKKDGNDDMAAQFEQDANNLQKQYDDLRKSSQYDVDKIIQDVLGSDE